MRFRLTNKNKLCVFLHGQSDAFPVGLRIQWPQPRISNNLVFLMSSGNSKSLALFFQSSHVSNVQTLPKSSDALRKYDKRQSVLIPDLPESQTGWWNEAWCIRFCWMTIFVKRKEKRLTFAIAIRIYRVLCTKWMYLRSDHIQTGGGCWSVKYLRPSPRIIHEFRRSLNRELLCARNRCKIITLWTVNASFRWQFPDWSCWWKSICSPRWKGCCRQLFTCGRTAECVCSLVAKFHSAGCAFALIPLHRILWKTHLKCRTSAPWNVIEKAVFYNLVLHLPQNACFLFLVLLSHHSKKKHLQQKAA